MPGTLTFLPNRPGLGAGLWGRVRPWVRQGRSAERPGRFLLPTPAREGASASAPAAGGGPVPLIRSIKSTRGGSAGPSERVARGALHRPLGLPLGGGSCAPQRRYQSTVTG